MLTVGACEQNAGATTCSPLGRGSRRALVGRLRHWGGSIPRPGEGHRWAGAWEWGDLWLACNPTGSELPVPPNSTRATCRIRTDDLRFTKAPGASANAGANEPCPHQSPQTLAESTTDADLSAVVSAWATLPPALRAGIVAMIRAAEGRDERT